MEDYIVNGVAHGGIAQRLLATGLNPGALRPYIDPREQKVYVTVDVNGKPRPVEAPTANATLTYDVWKEIDERVNQVAEQRLVGVSGVIRRGLVYRIANGMGKTVLATQNVSDLEAAQISMDGVTRGREDRPEFDISYLPLPIIHSDFSFSLREIEASRNGNQPLDTTAAALAGRQVAEKIEEIYFQGASTYAFGGGVLYGLEDYTNRNTGSLTAAWSASAASGSTILTDVLAMKQALINKNMYGPYTLYVPTNFETALDEDFKANSDRSIRERLSQVSGLGEIVVADKMTSSNVLMVQMTEDVVRMVIGLDITTVQWEIEGGMRVKFKVMAIMVPQIRSDKNSNCGVAHYS